MPLGPVVTGGAGDAVTAEALVGGQVGLEVLPLGLGTGLGGAAVRGDEVDAAVYLTLGVVASAVAVVVERILCGSGEPVGDLGLQVDAAHKLLSLGLAVVEGLVELGCLLVLVGTAGGEGAVRIFADVGRRHHNTAAEHREVVVGHRVLDTVGEVEGGGSGQPLGDVEGGVAVHREVAEGAHSHHTVVTEVTHGSGILHILVAAVDAYIFFMVERRVIPFVLPVVVRVDDGLGRIDRVGHREVACGYFLARSQIAGRVGGRGLGVADTCTVGAVEHERSVGAHLGGGTHDGQEFGSVGHLPGAGGRGEAHLRVEDHLRLLERVAFLGGHEDNAVGSTASVDSRGSCILEHLDGLDIVGVEVVDASLHAVHQEQRVVATVDGRAASDKEPRALAGEVVVGGNAQTGDLALEGVTHRGHGSVHKFFAVHLGDGSTQGFAGLGTVTDHHHVVQDVLVVGQGHVDGRTSADGHDLGGVADEAELQGGVGCDRQGEASVSVGRGALRGTLDHNSGTGKRIAVGIDDTPGHNGRALVLRLLRGKDYRVVDDFPGNALAAESPRKDRLERSLLLLDGYTPQGLGRQVGLVGKQHAGLAGEGRRERADCGSGHRQIHVVEPVLRLSGTPRPEDEGRQEAD